MTDSHWIIVGGGATGAAIALRGAQVGHRVTLVDKAPTLGGLTATEEFTLPNAATGEPTTFAVDRFYHVVLESDRRVLALLDELGLKDTVRWTSAPAEIISKGVRYPATTLVNMATLPMLTLLDRARIGASIAASLALPMKLADKLTAQTWLGATAGRSAMDAFWGPILRAKLGTQASKVSATFMVSTFRRLVQARLEGAGDRFGVLPSGYGPVFDEMLARTQQLGGQVRTGVQATAITSDDAGVHVTLDDGTVLDGQRVFVTTPGPIVNQLVEQLSPAERTQLTSAPWLGVVCGSFLLATPPNDSYITYLVDDVQLTGVIGMHALLGADQTAGASLVYLPHYCGVDDEWFELSDDQVRERMLAGLRQAFPDFEPQVLASSINRARHVVPLPVPHAQQPLAFHTSVPGVSVVGTAQNTTGTLNVEASLELVDEALSSLPQR